MFNTYYSTVFSRQDDIPHIQSGNSGVPFITDVKIIRRRIKAIGKNKSVGPDRVSGEILKLGGTLHAPYDSLMRCLANILTLHARIRLPEEGIERWCRNVANSRPSPICYLS